MENVVDSNLHEEQMGEGGGCWRRGGGGPREKENIKQFQFGQWESYIGKLQINLQKKNKKK